MSPGPLASSTTEIAVYDDGGVGYLGPLGSVEPYPSRTHGSTLAAVSVGF